MGGCGSTRWTCENIKDTVEGKRYLDVNRMSREGSLGAGCRGTLEWTRNDEPFGSIRFRREGNFLILSYCVQQSGGEWRDIEEHRRIRERVAREIRPEFVGLIEDGHFVPTYAEIVSMTPQEVLDRSQQR